MFAIGCAVCPTAFYIGVGVMTFVLAGVGTVELMSCM